MEKAINATTVEVTFEEAVTELNELNFAIEGLTISNKVLKQTDSKTVVLTTSAQTADVEYTVTVNGEAVGSFKGVSAVVPTAVKTVVASQQGVIGKEVTLSAEVTVADGQSKAGIPVTFNITTGSKNNDKIEAVAITNDKGVATHSYTRYYNGTDEVVAYATNKATVKDSAKVYWASSALLEVKEAKSATKLANNAKKLYNVEGDKNGIYAVIFKENIDVKSKDSVDAEITDAIGYIDEKGKYTTLASDKSVATYQYTSGGARYAIIQLDKDGEGSFNVTGEDVKVTPVVYRIGEEDIDFDLDKTTEVKDFEKYLGKKVAYDRTYLQSEGTTVEFALKHSLAIEVESIGDEDAAAIDTVNGKTFDGGRDYKAIVKDEDGKLVGKGTPVYVSVEYAKGDVSLKAATSYGATL